jgi:integrase
MAGHRWSLETLTRPGGGKRFRGRITLGDGTRIRVPVPDAITAEERARERVAAMQEQEDLHGLLLEKARKERAVRAARSSAFAKTAGPTETCDQWHERYLESCTHGSVEHSRGRWRKWWSPRVGSKLITKVTSDDVELVRDDLDAAIRRFVTEGRGEGRLMPKAALNVWSVGTTAMRAACASKDRTLRVRTANPCEGVLPPEGGASRKREFIRPSEAMKLLACSGVPMPWREVYAVALYTYLRPGELWELRALDVDLEAGLLSITRAYDWEDGCAKPPKTANGIRTVPLEPAIVPLLRRIVERRKPEELVFPQLRTLNENKIAGRFRDHLKLAGVQAPRLFTDSSTHMSVNFRSCRDTGITWLALAGVDIAKIQRRAGHDSLDTTMNYVKVAEVFTKGGIGDPFPTLPSDLIAGHAQATIDENTTIQAENECRRRESNPRPSAYETPALTN